MFGHLISGRNCRNFNKSPDVKYAVIENGDNLLTRAMALPVEVEETVSCFCRCHITNILISFDFITILPAVLSESCMTIDKIYSTYIYINV